MVTAKDVQGVMAMMPSFSTDDAGHLKATATVAVDNLQTGIDRMIKDGIDVITTTGSFGECYNLFWDEFKTIASASVEAAKKRVPLFIGSTSPNAREVVQRLKFIQDIGGVMTNQAQMFPYYRMGSSGCWSIDAWMGPWPVLYLRNLVRAGKDHEALQIITEIMSAAGGERPGGNEGATAKLPIEFAGYVKPGPARTPIVKFSESAIERAKKKAEGWKKLCDKYRPLVKADTGTVKAAS
jgi:dihydrodipicolinate synthase/N-acetylneuraminate lyase